MIKEYAETLLKEELKKYNVNATTVKYREVPKNNCILPGFEIVLKDSKVKNIAAIIYCSKNLRDMQESDIIELATKNAKLLQESPIDSTELQVLFNMSKKEILDSLILCAIQYKGNESYCENLIYRRMLDLALYLRIQNSNYTATFSKNLLECLGINEEEAFSAALENTEHNKRIIDIQDIIKELGGVDACPTDGHSGLYVVTTNDFYFGASLIFSEKVLHDICEFLKSQNIVVIPSSIAELIVSKYDPEDIDVEKCYETVLSVNKECVAPDMRLCDNVYVYNDTDKKIISFATEECYAF